ncbi:virulence RhuM family protein [Patescibacteria group bacterium]|nr:virulence RhuM family protein [Patescibacteria group bacterium]
MKQKNAVIIYQSKKGDLRLKGDQQKETIWASQAQIVEIFEVDQSVVSRHIHNIFKDKEVNKKSNMHSMHIANSDKPVNFYSLDVILAVGYRTNSSKAIAFRAWATKTLRQHMTQGYTLNKKRVSQNLNQFLKAVSEVKALIPAESGTDMREVLNLISTFANTWFSLEAYDSNKFPERGLTKKEVQFTTEDLKEAINTLRKQLINK